MRGDLVRLIVWRCWQINVSLQMIRTLRWNNSNLNSYLCCHINLVDQFKILNIMIHSLTIFYCNIVAATVSQLWVCALLVVCVCTAEVSFVFLNIYMLVFAHLE